MIYITHPTNTFICIYLKNRRGLYQDYKILYHSVGLCTTYLVKSAYILSFSICNRENAMRLTKFGLLLL